MLEQRVHSTKAATLEKGIRQLLGRSGDRAHLWMPTEQKLGIQFTAAQLDVMNSIESNAVIENCAGAGKTIMLLAFAAHFATHELAPLTFYATESNAMAQEV